MERSSWCRGGGADFKYLNVLHLRLMCDVMHMRMLTDAVLYCCLLINAPPSSIVVLCNQLRPTLYNMLYTDTLTGQTVV